jgi:hypothetical protein
MAAGRILNNSSSFGKKGATVKISHMARFMPAVLVVALVAAQTNRPRARDLGLVPGCIRRGHSTPSPMSRACAVGHVTRTGGYTVGVLVQTNFGGHLTMGGVPVGRELGRAAAAAGGDGWCMIVVATDAPLTDLKRLAARAVFGLARTGSSYSNGSGDFAVAFSTAASMRVKQTASRPAAYEALGGEAVSPLFEMALEATEEAVYNSLLQATTVQSKFGTAEAIPIDRLARDFDAEVRQGCFAVPIPRETERYRQISVAIPTASRPTGQFPSRRDPSGAVPCGDALPGIRKAIIR